MRNPDNGPLDDLVFDCCRELFAAYELAVEPRDREHFPATEHLAMCGVMGFGGKQMRGSLVLATTKEPLELTNPGHVDTQRDWVCELANQLMGRVKNRLLAVDTEIHLATPAGLSGENLCPSPRTVRAPQVFAAAGGFVCVWIDCEFAKDFSLPAVNCELAAVAISEGETLLF